MMSLPHCRSKTTGLITETSKTINKNETFFVFKLIYSIFLIVIESTGWLRKKKIGMRLTERKMFIISKEFI